MGERQMSEQGPWKCFHCGFTAHNEVDARAHFGLSGFYPAMCQQQLEEKERAHITALEHTLDEASKFISEGLLIQLSMLEHMLKQRARIGELKQRNEELTRWLDAHRDAAHFWQKTANERSAEIIRLTVEQSKAEDLQAALVAQGQATTRENERLRRELTIAQRYTGKL